MHTTSDGRWTWDGRRWLPASPYAMAATPAGSVAMPTNPGNNGTAMVALVVAIASWFVCWGIGGAIGLFLAVSAKREIARTGQAGDGVATVAVVVSAVQLGLVMLILAWLTLAFAGALASS